MDQVLSLINLGSSCALAALAAWAIMSPVVRDGIIVKVGLILMTMGHGIAALHLFNGLAHADLLGLNRARFLINAGLLIVVLGYGWRHRCGERLHHIVPSLLRDRQ
jgi:hypothetical protein